MPPAALFFACLQWREHGWPVNSSISAGNFLAGLARVLVGLGGHFFFFLFPGLLICDIAAFLYASSGVLILLGGKSAYRCYAFPLWFLMFMAPLPIGLQNAIGIQLQQTTAVLATILLEVLQFPVVREGFYIHLPSSQFEVGFACNGLKGTIAIFALSLAIGQLSNCTKWTRWVLVFAAFPIAIVANALRVVLSVVVAVKFGKQWSEGVYHDIEGLVALGLAVFMLLALSRFLNKSAVHRGVEAS